MGLFKWIGVVLVAVAVQRYVSGPPMWKVRKTDQHHQWHTLSGIWDEAQIAELDALVLESAPYKTLTKDMTTKVEHMGEALPIGPNNTCTHPYMIPNNDGTLCILPSRIDIARHYLKTGGVSGRKESYDKLVSRMQGFSRFFHSGHGDIDKYPSVQALFESEAYQSKAAEICQGRTVFDPMQLGIIMQLPGQEVPTHYDVPWFTGATRFTLPQWLLVAMDQSRLFEHLRLPQVQGVAYLHRWEPTEERGGGFFFFPEGHDGKMEVFPPAFNEAIIVDGAVVIHGTVPYRRDAAVPFIDKAKTNMLNREEDGSWTVTTDGVEQARYTYDDLRISFVWRQRCFESEEERDAWHNLTDFLSVEEVMDTFVRDLRAHGRIGEQVPEPLDLAMLLLDEYAPYPTISPMDVNVCMLPRVLPGGVGEVAESVLGGVC